METPPARHNLTSGSMRWRHGLVLLLILAPVLVFLVAGGWSLWETGRLPLLLWMLPLCWGAAYLLARQGGGRDDVPVPAVEAPRHWTEQDEAAWRLVERQQRAVTEISPQQLTEPQFFLDTAMELAADIARHYHPKAKDPLGSATVIEVLGVAELAIEESAQWVDEHVPGSHLLTLDHWRTLSKAPGWFRTARDLTWLSSLLLNPAGAVRHFSTRLAANSATRQIQANVVAACYVAFVRFAGFYLIEMNSGRLKGGAGPYRRLREKLQSAVAEPGTVRVALVGQVNAGKSSLVNALLGENEAEVGVLPQTRKTQQFRFRLPDASDELVLLDTPGYGEAGATAVQLEEITLALREADLVLLVMDATNPARQPDLEVLSKLRQPSASQPSLRVPPTIGALTHIDGLRPLMEWSPPYDWQHPSTEKERTIREAVDYNHQTFGELCQGMVPVCTDVSSGRAYGIEQWLLPAMIALLEEATACSLIRSLHLEVKQAQIQKLFRQLYKAGWQILRASVGNVTARDSRDV